MTAMDQKDVAGTTPARQPTHVAKRFHHAIGPIAGGLLLDAADLITFGPLGLYGGFVLGALVALWLTTLYRFTIPFRLLWAFLAGLYCTMPMTEPFPIATVLAAVHRFFHWSSE